MTFFSTRDIILQKSFGKCSFFFFLVCKYEQFPQWVFFMASLGFISLVVKLQSKLPHLVSRLNYSALRLLLFKSNFLSSPHSTLQHCGGTMSVLKCSVTSHLLNASPRPLRWSCRGEQILGGICAGVHRHSSRAQQCGH